MFKNILPANKREKTRKQFELFLAYFAFIRGQKTNLRQTAKFR